MHYNRNTQIVRSAFKLTEVKRILILSVLIIVTMAADAQTYRIFKGDTINRKDGKGLKQGVWKKYYKSDKIFSETFFKNDKQTGVTTFYYETGKVKSTLTWIVNGVKARSKAFYENGKLQAEGIYQNQKKDSTWNYYGADEKISSIENYRLGLKNGIWLTYYPEGGKVEEITYVNDRLEGPYKKYFRDGKLMMDATYKNNSLTGKYIVYNPDGLPYTFGTYLKGERDGKWTLNDEKGRTFSVSQYNKGLLLKTDTIR